MERELFIRRVRLPVSAEAAFRWHARPGAFERLLPPWERVEILSRTGGIEPGARIVLLNRLGPLKLKWIAEHGEVLAGRQFRDVQVSGPFALWEHTHRFEPDGPDACWLEDRIAYRLPGGRLGHALAGKPVRQKLERMFHYRHATVAHDLAAQTEGPPMNILISGASGLVGAALAPFLTTGGQRVVPLRRSPAPGQGPRAWWNPATGEIDLDHAGRLDAVVHLAGETIAQRWTPAAKGRIRASRVNGTQLVSEALARLPQPPKVLVSASAVGFYGSRGDEVLDESSASGSGFLAEVSREWEAATAVAEHRGIRVVHLRLGIVLSAKGGALGKMLPAFRLGLGGPLAGGHHWWSWIALDDVLGVIQHALVQEKLSGPVNVVSPQPVTNREFTHTLGAVLRRPTIFGVPHFAIKLLFGQMGQEALLASQRVKPTRLEQSGFAFRFARLEPALRHLLGRAR